MFQPPIQSPYDNGWKVMNQPPSVQIKINTTQWDASLTDMSVDTEATNILARYYGELSQFVASCRQARDLGGIHNYTSFRDWPQISVAYYSVNQTELVTVGITPTNTGSQGKAPSEAGNTFDIKWSFISFPYPGMTQNGGTLVPEGLQYNGVQYIYDPGFSPSAPGPTSKVDATTGVISCKAPILTPDLNYMLTSVISTDGETAAQQAEQLLLSQMVGTRRIPTVKQVDNSGVALPSDQQWLGYTEDLWTKNLGASAIATTPLSGTQYWEVQIVSLPRNKVPDNFNVPLEIVHETGADGVVVSGTEWDGSLITSPLENFGAQGADWTWDATLDAFLTPAIGVCPGYFLPDDLLPGDPTAKPRLFNDYGRLLGMDQALDVLSGNLYDRARSVYVVALSVDNNTYKIQTWVQGNWQLINGSTATLYGTDSFITDPPPGGTPWPNPKVDFRGYKAVSSVGIYTGVADPQNIPFTATTDGQVMQLTEQTEVDNCFNGIPNNVVSGSYTQGISFGPYPVTDYYAPASGPNGGTGLKFSSLGTNSLTTTVVIDASIHETHQTYVTPINWTSTPPGTYFQWNNQTWECVGVDGTDMGDGTDIGDGILTHMAGRYLSPVSIPMIFGEIGTLYPLQSGQTDDAWIALYTSRYHTPAFIGRIDCLHQGPYHEGDDSGRGSGITYYDGDGSDSSIFSLGPNATSAMSVQGCYTGVDLGDLVNGDTVMIATDADQGYIWFGKNGKWYGKTGMLDPVYDGPAHGTHWAAVMDGFTKSAYPITSPTGAWARATAKPQYFPCVSYRLGPGEVKIVFDKAQLKYPPPAGFKVYGQAAAG
jgi:hypothetical protein